jgi:SAM-dependent methyltransferase
MADVSALYTNRESEDYLARDSAPVRALKAFVFKRLARSLLNQAFGEVRTAADYGTGNGMLATMLAEAAGPDTTVYALDFFDEAPGPMPRVSYLSFGKSAALHGKIDLLTCFHVLEHTDEPDTLLSQLRAFLRPNGTIVIEVPNVDCVWTPWFGKSCANWYPPYHRVHFSRQSLRRLIESQGLRIVSEQDICGPTFALSLATLLRCRPNAGLFFLAAVLRPLQWFAERVTRRPSALRIIARNGA